MGGVYAGNANLLDALVRRVGSDVLGTISRAGLAFDLVDDDVLARSGRIVPAGLAIGAMTYRAIVLPGVERIPVTTLRMLEDFAGSGAVLIATRRTPGRAPGFRATPDDHASVRAASARLFQASGAPGRLVTDEREELQRALSEGAHADARFTPAAPEVGFVHRRLPYADVYFVANTSNVVVETAATFAVTGTHAEMWDPMTGSVLPVVSSVGPTGHIVPRLELEPYGSRVYVFSDRSTSRGTRILPPEGGSHIVDSKGGSNGVPPPIALREGWRVRFSGDAEPRPMAPLRSWTKDPSRLYFSGVATYSREVSIDPALAAPGFGMRLEFGEARPVPSHELNNGMRAWLDAPVREAAVVWVNGARAGSVRCPPYALDLTGALRTGTNEIRIEVANLAINAMAGRPLPSYRLLNARYGTRFEPQDMDKVQPQPAGLLGNIRLVPYAR